MYLLKPWYAKIAVHVSCLSHTRQYYKETIFAVEIYVTKIGIHSSGSLWVISRKNWLAPCPLDS